MARPTDWDEPKERHQIRLTPTCWRHLGDVADANDLPSRAEAIEHLSRHAVKQCVNFKSDDLSLEAIASLDAVAKAQEISRSELIERYGRNHHLIEAVLDAVEDVLYNGNSTEECLPPHPSYEVDGDVFRKLGSAFMALVEAEEKG